MNYVVHTSLIADQELPDLLEESASLLKQKYSIHMYNAKLVKVIEYNSQINIIWELERKQKWQQRKQLYRR